MSLAVKISIKKETILNLVNFINEFKEWFPDVSSEMLFHLSSNEIVLENVEEEVVHLLKKHHLYKVNSERPAWDLRLTLNLFQVLQMCQIAMDLLEKENIPFFMLSFQKIEEESGLYFQAVNQNKVWLLNQNDLSTFKF